MLIAIFMAIGYFDILRILSWNHINFIAFSFVAVMFIIAFIKLGNPFNIANTPKDDDDDMEK